MYVKRKHGRSAVGDITTTLSDLGLAAKNILVDPALPQVTGIVVELAAVEKSKRGLLDTLARPDTTPGVGLKYAVTPLKAFLWYRKNPIMAYAAGALLLAVPFLIGRNSR